MNLSLTTSSKTTVKMLKTGLDRVWYQYIMYMRRRLIPALLLISLVKKYLMATFITVYFCYRGCYASSTNLYTERSINNKWCNDHMVCQWTGIGQLYAHHSIHDFGIFLWFWFMVWEQSSRRDLRTQYSLAGSWEQLCRAICS